MSGTGGATLPRFGPRLRAGSEFARPLWYCAAAAGVALVTLLLGLLQHELQPSRLQMSYLLLVLALAIGGGRGPAIFASILAFLSFDFFFVKPVGNLVVNDPAEWFALGLFLVVGVTTGTLAAGLKRSAAEAMRRTRETATLYELSITILADTGLERVLSTVVERLAAASGFAVVRILLAAADGELHLAAQVPPQLDGFPTHLLDRVPDEVLGSPGDRVPAPLPARRPVTRVLKRDGGPWLRGIYVPLALNGRALGVLTAYTELDDRPVSADTIRLLDAFAAQTSLAIGRVRLIEEEERAHAAAESDRLKSIFLASISHDLRTPLTAIRTAAALLHAERDYVAKSEAKESIDSEVDRLNHLVGNLLEMSRIEGGSAPPQLVLEDVAEIVGATADRFFPLLNGRILELRASGELPLVELDAAQIDRVLSNLFENAIKFSMPGSTISAGVFMVDGAVQVRIHNPGAAIPPDEQERIFDKFHRMQRPEYGAGGTGLGLAICKGIVEAHGGRIWTRNERGGVAFYVALPLPAPGQPHQAPLSAPLRSHDAVMA